MRYRSRSTPTCELNESFKCHELNESFKCHELYIAQDHSQRARVAGVPDV